MPRPFYHAVATAAALLLCAAAPGVHADTVGLHLGSLHIPAKDYNNTNPGAYVRLDNGWTGGLYRNSLRETSVYAGYTWTRGAFSVTAGGVSGYFDSLQPLLVPSVALFTAHGITTRIAFIPRVEKKIGAHVVHLMLEF